MTLPHPAEPPLPAETGPDKTTPIPFSFLDTDLYKLTMQNAVLQLYPDAMVTYKFTNRIPEMAFSRRCYDWACARIAEIANIRLTPEEHAYLRTLTYLPETYLTFLSQLVLNPDEQVDFRFIPDAEKSKERGEEVGSIECDVKGLWKETIWYEVAVMSILSEAYFMNDDTDWDADYPAIQALAKQKALTLLKSSCAFSEFGARRRRSYRVQDSVIQGLMEGMAEWKAGGGVGAGLAGTSNVHFAMKYNLRPIGTIAHEWIMAIGAKEDYVLPNGKAMDAWEKVYPSSPTSPLHTMLTDTYTLSLFLAELKSDPARAQRWTGLRHDSGSPIEFAKAVAGAWKEINALTGAAEDAPRKRVIFSDSLDVPRCLEIKEECERLGIDASFGVGTSFTNDFHKNSDPSIKSKPLNIVIKLSSIDGLPTIKLTDDEGKWAGKREDVEYVVKKLGLQTVKKMD